MKTVAELRSFALTRALGRKTDLAGALRQMGYLQADPIRAPARAQDLILLQRVRGYRVDDLERHYPELNIEEDALHNYGFVSREVQAWMHPREIASLRIEREVPELSEKVLEFVRQRGPVHPRDLDLHFERLSVGNYWGGNSSATTRVLDALHHRGKLRIVRRDKGIRVYGVAQHLATLHLDTLPTAQEQAQKVVELLLKLYAPLPVQSLSYLVSLSGYGAPHLKVHARQAFQNLRAQKAEIDGLTYLWPEGEDPTALAPLPRKVRLLSPFDPLVWDRRRFEHLHGWVYKFEAYTPAAKRKYGYYALPLLWGDKAVGWANLKVVDGELQSEIGFVDAPPKSKIFLRELESEVERYRAFLRLPSLDLVVSKGGKFA